MQLDPSGAPPKLFLLLLLAIAMVMIFIAVKGSRRRGLIIAALLFLGVVLLYFIGAGGGSIRPYPPSVPYPARTTVSVDGRAVSVLAEKEEISAVHQIAVTDDVTLWARDSIQGFRPACPWFSEAESARTEKLVGDTEFLYWEPVNGRLYGFSEQEPEREAAYRGARLSAQRKLAILSLVILKREDKRADVASAQPLAHRLARDFLREDARHLEKAKRPYGEVYRAAVVARAGPAEVNGLATAVKQEMARGWIKRQRSMTSWIIAIGASLVGAFAVFLFYTFANAGTKGYFAWPLRLASLAFFVLLCAGLFYLRSRLGAG